jgi:hypothetical protein
MWFQVETAGRLAEAALGAGEGEIVTVFRRGCYARFPGDRWVCFGEASLGAGPLNALVTDFSPPARGARIRARLQGSRPWRAPIPASVPRREALAGLKAAARDRTPDDGFGQLISGGSNPLIEHARPALDALSAWLHGAALAPEASQLVGLGPGLTPSGDDYLGGIMVGLHACGRAAKTSHLWHWLSPQLASRTSDLSAAHLAAAATGEAHECLHACISALTVPDAESWPSLLSRVAALGHCSGWDGLAGVVAAVEALG